MDLPANSSFILYRRRAALAIANTTALALAALSHHPVTGRAASVQETLAQIVALQRMDGIVHGALIVMLAMLAAGFVVFSVLLGSRRPTVLLALTAYGLGCCAMVAAMLLDGFVVPQLARQFLAPPAADAELARTVLRAVGITIQVLTKAGFLSMCAALTAWSHALWTGAKVSRRPRWCAAIGIAAGLLPSIYLLIADVRLTPASLTAIFGMHAVWNLAAAMVLYEPPTDTAQFVSSCRT
jgi:hypothetical protein